MRDAFGGVFMIRLMLLFVFIFVAFTAISLNYAKAFRVKNKVIDFIEEEEIMSLNDLSSRDEDSRRKCRHENGTKYTNKEGTEKFCYNGIVVEEAYKIDRTIVYNVYTYADWNLGSISMILTLGGLSRHSEDVLNGSWKISGEARVVKREYDIKRS